MMLHTHQPAGKTSANARNRRGNALVITMILIVAMAGLVAFAINMSLNANRAAMLRENLDQARAAAEYGAELAIGELTKVGRSSTDKTLIVGDWVGDGLYVDSASKTSPDSRRIGGIWGDHEYRVQVRSAGRAYAHAAVTPGYLGENWLVMPEGYTVPTPAAPVKDTKFSDIYEVTSSSRNKSVSAGRTRPELSPDFTVRTIVEISNNNLAGSIVGDSGALWSEVPSNFQATQSQITGEDHYLNKVVSETATKKSGARQLPAAEANYFAARGTYWTQGNLTLNYQIDENLDFGPVVDSAQGWAEHNAKKGVNAFRPWTRDFGTGINNRMMRKFDPSRKEDIYLLGGKGASSIGKTVVPITAEQYAALVAVPATKNTMNTNSQLYTTTGKTNGATVLVKDLPSGNNPVEPWKGKATTLTVPITAAAITDVQLPGGVLITESNTNQASPGGFFNVVMSSYDDLARLYINMTAAGIEPGAWWQHYFGEFTRIEKTTTIDGGIYPTEKYTGYRCKTMHILLNEKEEILVREFQTTNSKGEVTGVYSYKPNSSAKWTKKYRWSPYGDIGSNAVTDKNGRTIVPRMFQWQEILGYSLAKRNPPVINSKGQDIRLPALRMDFSNPNYASQGLPSSAYAKFGNKVIKINDGTQRTYPEFNSNGETIDAGFDEEYQNQEAETAAKPHLFPAIRDDEIEVWNPETNKYDKHKGMDSFLFQKNFGTAAEPVWLKALAIFIMYEDLKEAGADFNYTDLMFTIWVAPEIDGGGPVVTSGNNKSWWELDEEDGLTGGDSRAAISTSTDDSVIATGGQSDIDAHLDALGIDKNNGENDIYTGVNKTGDKDAYSQFKRAEFLAAYIAGEENASSDKRGILKSMENGSFYYTNQDLNSVMQRKIEDYILEESDCRDLDGNGGIDEKEYEDAQLRKALGVMRDLNGLNWDGGKTPINTADWRDCVMTNGVFRLVHVSRRFDMTDVDRESIFDPDATLAFKLQKEKYTIRAFVASLFGGKQIKVPAVYTDKSGTQRITVGEANGGTPGGELSPPDLVELGFLATEFQQKKEEGTKLAPTDANNDGTPESVPLKVLTDPQPDGSILTPKLLTSAAACYQKFVFPDGYVGGETNASLRSKMKTRFGVKEDRYSIGFHRSGNGGGVETKVEELKKSLLLDHYEYIALARDGANPYVSVAGSTPDGLGGYISLRKVERVGADGSPVFTYHPFFKPQLDDDGNPTAQSLPAFVFDKPIDGAGVMVAYGDMVVEDTFAYHGILVVLGDLIINPVFKTTYKYGADGNYVDSEGNSLLQDNNGKYYYVNENGASVYKDKEGKDLKPLTEEGFKGELVVQGTVMVKGKTVTNTNTATDSTGKEVTGTGKLTVMASDKALEDALNGLTDKFVLKRVQWIGDGNINSANLWSN